MAISSTKLVPRLSQAHRLLALPLCLLLCLWFATGTVLSFVPFPVLGEAQRVAGLEPVPLSQVQVEPVQALAGSGLAAPTRLRLLAVNGRPRYLVSGDGGRIVALDARTGRVPAPLDAGAAAAVAARFEGSPVHSVSGPWAWDLWTIHDKYPPARPYWRVALDDAAHTELYVSATTGEPMQRTVRRERLWNRLGATLHWLNVPLLRVHVEAWRWTVWTLALGGLLLASLGLLLGFLRWRAQQQTRRKGFSPFRGLQRWHHVVGSGAGLLLISWLGSGWLSLQATGWFSSGEADNAQRAAWAGLPLAAAAQALGTDALAGLPAAGEYEWRAVGGQPLLLLRATARTSATDAAAASGPVAWMPVAGGGLRPVTALPAPLLATALAAAWPGVPVLGVEPVASDDAWALRDAPFPAGTLRYRLGDEPGSWVHVDGRSGELLGVMDRSRRIYRWLVDGLHTLDFPLLDRGGLWHVLLVCATSIGFAFSLTGVVLAWRRLRRGWR